VTLLAVLGVLFLLSDRRRRNGRGILLLLLGMFLAYLAAYSLYFSGSVLVGVSVRYLLVLYPPLAILAAFGILGLGDWLSGLIDKGRHLEKGRQEGLRYLVCAVLVSLIFVAPFAYTVPFLANPTYNYYGFPLNNVTDKIQGLSPYTTGYAKASADFIQDNYELVPPNCLVLSGVPSMWFMLNRSSSSWPETDVFTNANYSGYGCYYLDYDFWCTVSPYNSTICKFYTTNYDLKLVATESSGRSANFSLYRILDYNPK
jgi:hypothetical protein